MIVVDGLSDDGPAICQHVVSEVARSWCETTLWCTMQPLSFTAGKKVGFMEKTAGESAGGLFSGQSGPKPPPALSVAVLGMKPGGKRSVGQIATVRLLLQEVAWGITHSLTLL